MYIRPSAVGGYDAHMDSSESWLILKALEALVASGERDSSENQLMTEMIDNLKEVIK